MKYRKNGAIGALLDEYEKALIELIEVISSISPSDLANIVDEKTEDKDCKSIQTILSHVINSGYYYIIEIRKCLGEEIEYFKKNNIETMESYISELKKC